MEHDLTDQLTRLLIEHLREPQQPRQTIQDRQLDTIYDLYHGYNGVMAQYQQNIGDIIRRIEIAQEDNVRPVPVTPPPQRQSQPRRPVRQPRPVRQQQPQVPTTNADMQLLFTYLLQDTNNGDNSMLPLSREVIAAATRTYGYTEEMRTQDASGNVCPISLDPYQVGDVICEIRGCNHIFRRPALMTWLRRNSRCPVCRYNLRDYVATEEAQASSTPNRIPFPSMNDLSSSRVFNFEFEIPIQQEQEQEQEQEEEEEEDVSDVEHDLSVD